MFRYFFFCLLYSHSIRKIPFSFMCSIFYIDLCAFPWTTMTTTQTFSPHQFIYFRLEHNWRCYCSCFQRFSTSKHVDKANQTYKTFHVNGQPMLSWMKGQTNTKCNIHSANINQIKSINKWQQQQHLKSREKKRIFFVFISISEIKIIHFAIVRSRWVNLLD